MKYQNSDLIGRKFGRLTILETFKKNNRRYCKCICDCGNYTEVSLSNILYNSTKSCGCLQRETSKEANTKHGYNKHKLYQIWSSMVKRCENKKNKAYKNYGERGIKICDEWRKNPEVFIKWGLSKNWNDDMTIDRIDVNGNYCPENCRFSDRHIQSVNQNIRKDNCSGYKGVKWNKINKKWQSYINVNGKHFYLGEFINKNDAVNARNKFIKENNLKEYAIQ